MLLIPAMMSLPGCKVKKAQKEIVESESGKKLTAAAGMNKIQYGSVAIIGSSDDQVFTINQIDQTPSVDGGILNVSEINVLLEKYEDTFNYYPVITVQKDPRSIYSEYKLSQGTVFTSGKTVKDIFTIFDIVAFDHTKPVILEIRACVEAEQSTSKNACGPWAGYQDLNEKPLFLKYLPDQTLAGLLTEQESLKNQIRETGLSLVAALPDTEPTALKLTTDSQTDLGEQFKSLGGHLTGEALLNKTVQQRNTRPQISRSGQSSNGQIPINPTSCFTEKLHARLTEAEQCKLSQYIGSETEFFLNPSIKFFWSAGLLCDSVLSCYPDSGCATQKKARSYYANPGKQCLPKSAKMSLLIGGVLLTGVGIAGGIAAMKAYGHTSSSGKSYSGKALIGGAVALSAIAVGIWQLYQSQNYTLTQGTSGVQGLIQAASNQADSIGEKLDQNIADIQTHLNSQTP